MPDLIMLAGVMAEVLAGILMWLGEGGGDAIREGVPESASIVGAILSHTLSSWFFARGFWRVLPRRYKAPGRKSLAFLFLVILILPVLGALGILWSVNIALKRPRSRFTRDGQTIVLPELPFSPPFIFPTPPYSEGALRQIVYFAERPLKRLKAVMATRFMLPRAAMPVWARATRDPVDDVRLLAYAMKDDHEKSLTGRIQTLTEALPESTTQMRAIYHKTIAALCWELVYHRLMQGALRQHWLDNARRHMELAFQISGHEPGVEDTADPDACLLYGRVLLESGKLDEAKAALGAAQAGGADEQKILPWLAEIAFEQGHYGQVKHYLSMLRQGGEKGKELAMVRAWWNK